jgi:hypothetical protein
MFGVLIFAWVLRRPQREVDSSSELAAALALIATDQASRPARKGSTAPSAASSLAVDSQGWASAGPTVSRPTGNRPTDWQARPALRFEAAPARDAVRRQITYRLVRLSEGPDDFVSAEIMRLDRGDEIEIVGQVASFLQVRTPTGEIGWVPSDSVIS